MSKTSQIPDRRGAASCPRPAAPSPALTILALPLLLAACRDSGTAGSAEKAHPAPAFRRIGTRIGAYHGHIVIDGYIGDHLDERPTGPRPSPRRST
jgi:hypothetical protein